MPVPQYFDFFQAGRLEKKRAFYADPVGGNAPHGKVAVDTLAPDAYHDALKHLDTLAVALDNARVHAHSVSGPDLGNVRVGFHVLDRLHQLAHISTILTG
jgi:hypothetical protein